jgi:hypothetical protein
MIVDEQDTNIAGCFRSGYGWLHRQ